MTDIATQTTTPNVPAVQAEPQGNLPARVPDVVVDAVGDPITSTSQLPVGGFDFANNSSHQQWLSRAITEDFGDQALAQVRGAWGERFGENAGIVATTIRQFPGVAQALERHGVVLHPAALDLVLEFGRAHGVTATSRRGAAPPAPALHQPAPQPTGGRLSDDAYEAQLRANRKAIAEAQAEGDSRRANKLYQEQMEFISQQRGNAPIVNGRRTA